MLLYLKEKINVKILRDFHSYSFQLIKFLLHFHSKKADVVLSTEYTGIGSSFFCYGSTTNE